MQAIVQSLQPYKRGTSATSEPLWLIQDFANIDKHRKPHLTGAILQGSSAGIGNMWGVNLHIHHIGVVSGAFKADTEVARINFIVTNSANYMVDMNINFTYGIAFDPKGPGAGELVVPTVRGLISHLRGEVFPKLEPFV